MTELNAEPAKDAAKEEPQPSEPVVEQPEVVDPKSGAQQEAVPPPMAPHPPTSAVKKVRTPGRFSGIPMSVRASVLGALVVGGLIGAAITAAVQPDPTTTTPYVALKGANSSQSAAIASDSASISALQSQKSGLQSQVDAAASQSAAVAAAQASVQAQESAVAQREQAVQSAQAVIVQNQLTAGEYVVGKDAKAGVYHTAGPVGSNGAGCFYEWRTGTDANASIIDNNISQGAATATLTDGQVFRTDGCQIWQKVG
ncbi:MAG TPA: hypothetical protein VJQ61_02470 [Sinomonas sp.]|nr:hypothetical protein [Sinomonas sp.]